ncbi:hypothetical protein LPJ61_000280 [Coemansia biformis]|uniref:Queuine tRNA-ribosyltransferase accessory subunit 2 n=1 Tax=Coemansia biformis TaxID=1286918 RepID=A0A9W8D0N2_9FUNG|nr:hypothetical protein LPJ61_000280 [Coemansia biformis]
MALRFDVPGSGPGGLPAARRGALVLERAGHQVRLETPSFIKYTRHGLQPHLLPDIVAGLGALPPATRVQLEDFLDNDEQQHGRFGGGLHDFAGVDRSDLLVLDVLDPTVTSRPAKSGAKAMAIDSEGGTRRLTPALFAELVDALKPDIVVPPADYVEEPLPSLEHGKRIEKSVTRSAQWLDECVSRISHAAAVFAPVMGSRSLQLRERYAKELAARQDVSGYVFNDVCLALPLEHKLDLVRHSLAHLDSTRPRYMAGASAPDAALRAVLSGIDLVDSSYPFAVTEQGFASDYALGGSDSGDGSAQAAGRLDLWQDAMRTDFRPLVAGCQCPTCARHHRAYIHHLLGAKEMLATVLLQVHNLHVYQRFFVDIRESMARGTLPGDAERFLGRYSCSQDEPGAAFGELRLLAAQITTPTTKIQRQRHAEQPAA